MALFDLLSFPLAVLLPRLMVLQGLLWALLPRRSFMWAVLLVFLAHCILFGYGLLEAHRFSTLPVCGEGAPGADCIARADYMAMIFPPEMVLIPIAESAIIWLLLFVPFAGLGWLTHSKGTT